MNLKILTTLVALLLLFETSRSQTDDESGYFEEDGYLESFDNEDIFRPQRQFNWTGLREGLLKACPYITSRNLPGDYWIQGQRLSVSSDFTLIRFVEIDDVQQSLAVYASLNFYWAHNCLINMTCSALPMVEMTQLCLNKSEDITLRVPPKQVGKDPVWYPRFTHSNAKFNVRPLEDFGDDIEIYFKSNHKVSALWYATGTFVTSCEQFSFTKFPFDELTCDMRFDSLDENKQVNYSETAVNILNEATFIGDSEVWQFADVSSSSEVIEVQRGIWPVNVTRIVFTFNFKRVYIYYIQSVFMPIFGLFIMQIAAFFMPPRAPDRPAFSMTVLLAYAVVLSLVVGMFPKTSEQIYAVIMVSVKFACGVFVTIYMLIACAFGKSEAANQIVFKSLQLSRIRVIDIMLAIISGGSVIASDIIFICLMVN